ncbi:MAG: hypothetical protein NZ872_03855 [Archaeoglobaceae archaeon]|nr:hypothetical protein [Archaeoglobaceae archaeon]MDW8128334.1 hypothetical protein [Archaeoglobaceae archaeon]
MRLGFLASAGILILLASIAGCLGSGVSGTYECTKSGSGFPTFSKGDTIEFKSGGEAIFRSRLGGPSIVGEYEVKGSEISIKISILGTKISFEGKVEGNKITMKDGAILEKR